MEHSCVFWFWVLELFLGCGGVMWLQWWGYVVAEFEIQ